MYWTEIIFVRNSALVKLVREHYSREDGEQAVFDAMRDPEWFYAEVHYGNAYDSYNRRTV